MGQAIRKRNNVQVLGSGPETLVFAHGFGSEQSVWRHQVAEFQKRYRIILFDHVGCGGSDFNAYSPHRYGGLHSYAEDLLELCEELKLTDCVLVGHSLSGMVGLLAAVMEPRRFRQLVFVKASPRYLNDSDAGYRGGFEQSELDGLYAAMSANYPAWASGFAPLAMGNPERPELGQEFVRTLSAMRPDIALSIARIVFQSDHRMDLSRLKVPTLILQSGEDLAVPDGVGEYMARRIPLAKLCTLEARGHLPHLSAPEAVNRAIGSYLSASA
jgi:sigma-B regulation protein RsbQ